MISFPERIPFENHFDGGAIHLRRADTFPNDKTTRDQIASICNQPLVYDTLFRDRLEGATYSETDADEFIEWAHSGWQSGSHFVFFATNESNRIIGAVDIKSADLAAAEIGYWADSNYPGNMTNAVAALIHAAVETGFSRFTAYVKHNNQKSIRVLERAGFISAENGNIEERPDFLALERNA